MHELCTSFPACGCFCHQVLHLGAMVLPPFHMSHSRLAQAAILRSGHGEISAAGLSEKPSGAVIATVHDNFRLSSDL